MDLKNKINKQKLSKNVNWIKKNSNTHTHTHTDLMSNQYK